jgi:outer membrane receptor protein involved in Fe transport
MSQVALAQQAPESTAVDTLEEIVVSATKRDTLLQETPLAITAISGDALERRGAQSLEDFFREVPGLVVQEGETGGGRGRMSIRGVRSQGEATVAMYYGETPIVGSEGTAADPGGRTGDLAVYDLRRVEVLRGPQGTLYGSSSMGGAVRYIFNDPDPEALSGRVRTEVSSTEHGGVNYGGAGMLNLPLTDQLALRTVGTYTYREGYIDQLALRLNDTNDMEQYSVRSSLQYTPTDTLSLTLMGIHQDSQLDDAAFYRVALGQFNHNWPTQYSYDEQFDLLSAVVKWDLGPAQLVSASAWQNSQTERTVDATATILSSLAAPTTACRIYFNLTAPAACSTAQRDQYLAYAASRSPGLFYAVMDTSVLTQELRLSSSGDGAFQWSIGGYFEDRDDDVDSYVVRADAATGRLIEPLDVTGLRYIATDYRQWAAFGEGTYEFVPGWSVTAGLRYYDYTKTVAGEVVTPSAPTFQAASPYTSTTTGESGIVGKFGVNGQLTDDLMVYATAAEGFRPGGTNNTPNIPQDLIPFEADSLWSYELGLKTQWLQDKLVVNVAGYRIDWDNIQVSTRTADNVFSFITNAGAARVYGFEAESNYRPTQRLTLGATFNVMDSHLTEDQINSSSLASATIGRAGDKIPYVPRYSGSASISYLLPLSGMDLIGSADYSYTGTYSNTFRRTASTYRRIGNYSILNLRLTAEFGRYSVAAFVKNATDANEPVFSDGTTLAVAPWPRTVGVSFEASFGER